MSSARDRTAWALEIDTAKTSAGSRLTPPRVPGIGGDQAAGRLDSVVSGGRMLTAMAFWISREVVDRSS